MKNVKTKKVVNANKFSSQSNSKNVSADFAEFELKAVDNMGVTFQASSCNRKVS